MNDLVYSTDSDEHLVNVGEKLDPEWDYITEQDLEQDLYDSWDLNY